MRDIITNDDSFVSEFNQTLEQAENLISKMTSDYRPVLGGEVYLTNEDVCSILHVSGRTLQEYRNMGIISYIQLPGKIIYRESDLNKLLEDNYFKRK